MAYLNQDSTYHSCLTTQIKNISGRDMVCSFLPPHGRTILADEHVNVVGDVFAVLSAIRGSGDRKIKALLAALDAGDLEIRRTPAPIFIDETTGVSKALSLHGGSAQFDTACWDHHSVSEE